MEALLNVFFASRTGASIRKRVPAVMNRMQDYKQQAGLAFDLAYFNYFNKYFNVFNRFSRCAAATLLLKARETMGQSTAWRSTGMGHAPAVQCIQQWSCPQLQVWLHDVHWLNRNHRRRNIWGTTEAMAGPRVTADNLLNSTIRDIDAVDAHLHVAWVSRTSQMPYHTVCNSRKKCGLDAWLRLCQTR